MQKTLSYYDNYEKFDCDLFHNSLGNRGFENEDLKNSNIDQQAIDENDQNNEENFPEAYEEQQ